MEDQNHELAGLAGIAAEADQAAAGVAAPGDPTAPELAPPGPDYATEAAGMVDMLGAMICGYSPACAPLWGTETKQRMSMSVAPVMEKYGFSFGAMPCEMTAIVVCGPVLYQSARIIGAQMAEDKVKAAEAQQQAAARNAAGLPAPKAPDDAPAAAVHPQMALYA